MSVEMLTKLFNAQSVMFTDAHGRNHGMSREAYIAAATIAAKAHPAGYQMVLADNSVDDLSLEWLLSHLTAKLGKPELATLALLIALGRPLPAQIDGLVAKHPRYDKARREARLLAEQAKRAHRAGKELEYKRLSEQRTDLLRLTRDDCASEIMQTGRCPVCGGTGKRRRADDECHVCHGSGKVIPALSLVGRLFGSEAQQAVERAVEHLQMEQGEFCRALLKQEAMEREAV